MLESQTATVFYHHIHTCQQCKRIEADVLHTTFTNSGKGHKLNTDCRLVTYDLNHFNMMMRSKFATLFFDKKAL